MFALFFLLAVVSVFAAGLWVAVWIYNHSFVRPQATPNNFTEADEFPVVIITEDTPQQADVSPYAPPHSMAALPNHAIGIRPPTFIRCVEFGVSVAVLHAGIEVAIALSLAPISGGRRSPAQVALVTWLHPWILFGLGFLVGVVLMWYILPTTFRRALVTNLIMYAVFIAVAGLILSPVLLFNS